MLIRWYGQSAFTLHGEAHTVVIDPFDQRLRPAGMSVRFRYPQIPQQQADLVLITHEHFDHNGVGVVDGDPQTIRSTAGRFENAVGEVVSICGEHDQVAGTARGPNSIVTFALDGVRICHMGDFGQAQLRPEQRAAIGGIDLLLVPVGGGPTLDAAGAFAVAGELRPRWIVPMHYRTQAIDFLEPPDAFLAMFESVHRSATSEIDLSKAPQDGVLHVLQPAAP